MPSLILPNALRFGFSRFLVPRTTLPTTLPPIYSSSLLIACPHHFKPFSCNFADISPTFVIARIPSSRIVSSVATPHGHGHLSILIQLPLVHVLRRPCLSPVQDVGRRSQTPHLAMDNGAFVTSNGETNDAAVSVDMITAVSHQPSGATSGQTSGPTSRPLPYAGMGKDELLLLCGSAFWKRLRMACLVCIARSKRIKSSVINTDKTPGC